MSVSSSRDRLLLAALLVVGLISAAVIGALVLRSSDYGPVAVAPSPPLSPSPASGSGPATASASTPSTSASLGALAASSIDPVILLRVDIRPDVSVGRMPSLTVYRDGSVLRPADAGGSVARLTPAGIALVLAPTADSDLFVASGEIRPDPSWAAGFVQYTIDVRRGDELVHRSTTNVLLTPSTRAESQRIIALAERLDHLESWLPADAWATDPASAVPYVPSDLLLKVTISKDQPGIAYPPQLDLAAIDWPVEVGPEAFGVAVEPAPLGAETRSRCGPVTQAEAMAVERALAAAPPTAEGERIVASLAWAAARSHVTISLSPLFPDEPLDCAVDLAWP